MEKCFLSRLLAVLAVFAFSFYHLGAQTSEPSTDKWQQSAFQNIRVEEYNIRFDAAYGFFSSPNRNQNLRINYLNNGFFMKPRTEAHGEWSISMNLETISKGGAPLRPSADPQFCSDLNSLDVRHTGFDMHYENSEEGMRQNFIINNIPAGNEPLTLSINIESNLLTAIKSSSDLLFYQQHPRLGTTENVAWYKGLAVWDANGRTLDARMVLEGNELKIIVDDANAVYPVTVDPLSTTANWQKESDQATAYFGFAVSAAGDVNGDGYGDVIIGAPLYDNGQTDEGRAFVYHGSATGLSTTAAWTYESNNAGDGVGYAVNTAGDVNGDGYSDVIVGAYHYSNGQANEGRALVFQGSSTGLSAVPAWSYESNQINAALGSAVACAGDVNGDGYSDVIVGADLFDNGQTDEGVVFVFHGSSTGLSATVSWTGENNQASADFGHSVNSAGDVNGDGYSDIVIGSPLYDNGQTNEGAAFVYLGSSSGLAATAAWSTESNQANADYGISVNTAGDMNGDGYADVIVGADLYDNGQTDEGKAYLYNGSSTGLSTSPSWTYEANAAGSYLGAAVACAADVNGDGYSDILIGASRFTNGETGEGRAFLFFGSSTGPAAAANWTAEANQATAYFGAALNSAGDVNGDGYADVIVGSYLYDNGQTDEGRVYVFHGSAAGLATTSSWTNESNQASAYFGWCVSSAGDINGDGYSDVLVGAPYYDVSFSNEGAVFVYYGSATGLSVTANWTGLGNASGANYGYSAANAGDVNGDGYSDIIVGAYGMNSGSNIVGAAYVYFGSAIGLSSSADWSVIGTQVNASYGYSVAGAGDVNGDGFSDVIVGAYLYDNGQTDEGKVFVYHGSPSGPSVTENWTTESNIAAAQYGLSVSSAGDVNGDGYSDVLVGAPGLSNGSTNEGRAYLYYGSSTGLSSTAAWTTEPNFQNMGWASCVASAGDVNGDGYADVIIASKAYDGGQTDEGRVSLFYGSSTGLPATESWYFENNKFGAYLGTSAASAGDINGDGYSDLIAGSPSYTNGQTNEGRVYIFYGSATGYGATPDTLESNQANAYYGYCVSGAGDVNGDGYSDVIIGSYAYDNGQTDEGLAVVFYGNNAKAISRATSQYDAGGFHEIQNGNLLSTSQLRISHKENAVFNSKVKLIYQLSIPGTTFSAPALSGSSAAWTTAAGPSGVNVYAEKILPDNKLYHWRARTLYNPATAVYGELYGKWFTMGAASDEKWNGNVRYKCVAPVVVHNPTASTICEGANVSFSVTSGGTGVSYQWQLSTNGGTVWNNQANGGVYSGMTSSTMTITTATAGMNAYQYRCFLSGTCAPTATSTGVILTVNLKPNITVQPLDASVCNGYGAAFSVNATGTGISYQWQISTNGGSTWANQGNGSGYSGMTTAAMALTTATSGMNNYLYHCVVTGSCAPPAVSSNALLAVNTSATITTNPSGSNACAGGNTSFSVVAGGSAPFNYQWQLSINGGSTWANQANNSLYSGMTLATMNITGATVGMFNYKYRCVVSNACPPSTYSTAGTLSVNGTIAQIAGQPVSVVRCPGTQAVYTVTATGNPAPGYQWYGPSGILSGSNSSTLTLNNVSSGDAGNYYCVVSSTCNSVNSNNASLTLHALPQVLSQSADSSRCTGSRVAFFVTAGGSPLPVYQWYGPGGQIAGATSDTLNIAPITSGDAGVYYCRVSNLCDTVQSVVNNLNVVVLPVIHLGNDTTLCAGQNITLTTPAGYDSYAWSTGEILNQVTIDSTGFGIGPALIYLTALDSVCSNSDSILITFDPCTFVSENLFKGEIVFYPNPAEDEIFVEVSNGFETQELLIFDALGRIVKKSLLIGNKNRILIDDLTSGTYVMIVSGREFSKPMLLIKQ
ncbi:MAG: FG-GAP-like repeat-containing protein [Bacteroidota bacterium]